MFTAAGLTATIWCLGLSSVGLGLAGLFIGR